MSLWLRLGKIDEGSAASRVRLEHPTVNRCDEDVSSVFAELTVGPIEGMYVGLDGPAPCRESLVTSGSRL
jgi:hypothetical protein